MTIFTSPVSMIFLLRELFKRVIQTLQHYHYRNRRTKNLSSLLFHFYFLHRIRRLCRCCIIENTMILYSWYLHVYYPMINSCHHDSTFNVSVSRALHLQKWLELLLIWNTTEKEEIGFKRTLLGNVVVAEIISIFFILRMTTFF